MNGRTLIPVIIVSGFLGSGKTTLIRNLLTNPDMGESAVIVNEFGEVGLDHYLVRKTDERTVLLNSGCVCCGMRGDLAEALRDLLATRTRGEVPPVERVVVETTGLADPAPILHTLVSEPVVRNHFHLQRLVTTIDAVHGAANLQSYGAAVQQVAAADAVVVTKQDLASDAAVHDLKTHLQRINPSATLLDSSFGAVDVAALIEPNVGSTGGNSSVAMLEQHITIERAVAVGDSDHLAVMGVTSVCIVVDEPLHWQMFAVWLTMLLHRYGDRMLRVKGLLNVDDERGPLLLQGVQHVLHTPRHLPTWPDADRRSRIVFIMRDIDPQQLEASFRTFQQAAAG
jgi:G3E family GTPase